jgi:hypothetical protein
VSWRVVWCGGAARGGVINSPEEKAKVLEWRNQYQPKNYEIMVKIFAADDDMDTLTLQYARGHVTHTPLHTHTPLPPER